MRFFAITILFLSIVLIGCETTQETIKPEPEPTQAEPEPPEQVADEVQDHIISIIKEAGHEEIADKLKKAGFFENAEKKAGRHVVEITGSTAAILGLKGVNDILILAVNTHRGARTVLYDIYTLKPIRLLKAKWPVGLSHTFNIIIRGQDESRTMAEFAQTEPEPPEQVADEAQDHVTDIIKEAGLEEIADAIKKARIFENAEKKAGRYIVEITGLTDAILGIKGVDDRSVLVVEVSSGTRIISFDIYVPEPIRLLEAKWPVGLSHTFNIIIRGWDERRGTIKAELA